MGRIRESCWVVPHNILIMAIHKDMKLSITKNLEKGFIKEGIPLILLALLLIGVVIFLFYNLKSAPSPPTPPVIPTAEDAKMLILASAGGEDTYGDMTIESTSQYQVTYIAKDDYFILLLLSTPLSEARKAAEEELLERSGGNLAALCDLTVDVGAPMYVMAETEETIENPHSLNICK